MTITTGSVQLACRACGQSAVVAIDVHQAPAEPGRVSVQVAMSAAGLQWIDAHQAPYVVPRPTCGETT